MDNFNIRAYLAEGRLNEEEGVNSRKILATLEDKLKNHDFTYGNADGKRYTKGVDERKEINDLIKALGKSDEAIALYNRYAAKNNVNNNGSDYTIKKDSIKEVTVEEKRPDYPDVDKDGDTEESMEKALKDRETSTVTNEATAEDAEGTNFDYDYADIGQFYLEGLNKPFDLTEDELKDLGESIVRTLYKGDIKAAYDDIVHSKDLSEDLDIGHEDNEPGMLKADLYKIGKQAMELYQIMDNLEGKGEIDFPHWWQSKINTAKNMIDGAKHYLEFEINEPAIDATIDAVDMEESIDREFHTTSNTNGHPNWKDLSADEIQDYIDAPSIPLWGRELRTAEMVRDQKIDSTVTEDISLDDEAKAYFMGKVKKGEIDTLPEDPKAEYLAQMTKDQMDHDKETSHKEGELEEDSFYTDDIKNKVVSKLMDQLKK